MENGEGGIMNNNELMPIERIADKIHVIRKQRVMLDRELAELYGVETRVLNQAIKRNLNRFPIDFMFQLSKDEVDQILRSQFVILGHGQYSKYLPYAFTEMGVAMLSTVLKSEKAIEVNILIMRVFTRLRNLLASNEELRRKVAELDHEQKYIKDDVKALMSAVDVLLDPSPEEPKKRIGFYKADDSEKE